MPLPIRYTLGNIAVRRSATALTALGIAMTVAVFAGVLALNSGFQAIYTPRGDSNLAIYLRPGATSEGESVIRREEANILTKERPEVAEADDGRKLAAAELFLAVYMDKVEGGVTNVALRGIQPMSLPLRGDTVRLVEGRWFEWGSDQLVVGRPLTDRMLNCRVGDTLSINTVTFRVVGVFEAASAEGGEIWGDAERMMAALDRPVFSRVIARVHPGTDLAVVAEELKHDERTPVNVVSEVTYLGNQTTAIGKMLETLAGILSAVMGVAAVLGAMNTMLASVAARTHEIGVLLAIGYSRASVFFGFLLESAVIGLIGGALGLLIALPFDGVETGFMNWNTFTDVSFAFRLTPALALQSFVLAFLLGLIGGALPALRAARLRPVEAFREL
ncbi:MAG TPA: ABC transporter permease [Planctomycetota bacterium]|nr:ABC transporter permease [Planctomycetota bacterium]